MPSPSNLPLSFNRVRAVRQLDASLEELLEKLKKHRPSEDPWIVRRAYEIASERHHDQFRDRKSTRLNSSHSQISYAVFCLKTKKQNSGPRLPSRGAFEPVHVRAANQTGERLSSLQYEFSVRRFGQVSSTCRDPVSRCALSN